MYQFHFSELIEIETEYSNFIPDRITHMLMQ